MFHIQGHVTTHLNHVLVKYTTHLKEELCIKIGVIIPVTHVTVDYVKMNKTTLIVITLLGILLLGASYRSLVYVILNEYEEVCVAHNYTISYETHCRCDSYFRYAVWCNTECCTCSEDGKVYYNNTIYNYTEDCIEYRLTRYV